MEFKTFLKKNHLTVTEVAATWGIPKSNLVRFVNGQRWPNALVLILADRLSGGKVTLADWVKTCRAILPLHLLPYSLQPERHDDGPPAKTEERTRGGESSGVAAQGAAADPAA